MGPAKPGSLARRVVSALVMAPAALAAVWFGWPWLPLLVALAAGLMGWEWGRLCRAGSLRPAGLLIMATCVLAVVLAAVGREGAGVVAALAGGLAVLVASRAQGVPEPAWAAAGTLWVALPCVAFLYLAADPAVGRASILWLLALVWATDIGAYAAGRGLGGPRLAPRISPNKTWAGFAGGLAAAALVGAAAAALLGARPGVVVPVSAGLSIVAQLGDLAESLAKRHFGVKDSSGLIPGHGGLLDRLDSVLTAGAAQALLTLVAGASPLVWRVGWGA